MGNQAALQMALSYFIRLSEGKNTDEIKGILRRAARTKVRIRQDIAEVVIPKSLKIRVDKDSYEKAESLFMKALELERIRKPYFARVLLMNCFLMLQEENRDLGVSTQSAATDVEPVKENGQRNATNVVYDDTQGQRRDETFEKLQRLKEFGIVADMLLRNAPEDEPYIQQILDIVQRRGINLT